MLPMGPLSDIRGMVRQNNMNMNVGGPGLATSTFTGLNNEDKNSQLYSLLNTQPEQPVVSQPAYTELGVLCLVPVVIWNLISWALSYVGDSALLHKFELFAFLPAFAAAFACERIRHLRSLPAQLTCLKEENEWFKSSNAELKNGVDLLRAENEEARSTNMKLQSSIQGLESVRSAIETYASRHETDFGHVLSEFQKSVAEQESILRRTRQIQRRTRRLAEAQWRALMLNLFQQVERYAEGKRGMTPKGFEMWLAMLPAEISERLSPETFEEIDANGDGIVEVKEMCAWVQRAVKTLLRVDQGDSDGSDDSEEETTAAAADAAAPIFANPFGNMMKGPGVQGIINPFGAAAPTSSRREKESRKTGSRPPSSRNSEDGEAGLAPRREASYDLGGGTPPQSRPRSAPKSGINFNADGGMRLFATHPPANLPNASSPTSAGTGSAGGGSPGASGVSQASALGGGAMEKRNSSRRDLSLPAKTGTSRPSFNEGYMQKLFGGSPGGSPATARRSSTDNGTPNSRAASTPNSMKNNGGSPSRSRTSNQDDIP